MIDSLPGGANERQAFYLAKAEEAERCASRAINAEDALTWGQLARGWRFLAEQAPNI